MKSVGSKVVDKAFSGLVKAKTQLEKGLEILHVEKSNIESQQDVLRVKALDTADYMEYATDGIKKINAVLPKGFA